MYLPFSELRGFAVVGPEVGAAADAAPVSLGTLDDLHVDGRDWRVVDLVVATGGPLSGRRALLGTERPAAFDLARRELRVAWTPYDVETAPDAGSVRTAADVDEPPPGAGGALLFGPGDPAAPDGGQAVLGGDPDAAAAPPTEQERRLHRASDLTGREVVGTDAPVGRITDLLVDRDAPRIAWLAVDAGSWLTGREVVLDPAWASDGPRADGSFTVPLTRERVREAPALASLDGLDHAYGAALAAFYRLVD